MPKKRRKFSHSYEVCSCRHVTLGEIIYAIEQRGARSIEDISKFTDAGTCCKSCISKAYDNGEEKKELYLEEILKKFNGKT